MTPATVHSMTPEDELCLLLARGQLIPEGRKRILELLATPLRWSRILERAYSHQVYPLLYRSLIESWLPRCARGGAVRTKKPVPGQRSAQSVDGRGIGPTARTARRGWNQSDSPEGRGAGAITFRRSGGTSLFRHRHSCSSRRSRAGETRHPRQRILQPVHRRILRQTPASYNCGMLSGCAKRAADLSGGTSLDAPARLGEKTRRRWLSYGVERNLTDFFGVQALQLTPEWQFLYLSFHAAYHKWNTLKWLADVHELCVSIPVDWKQVRKYAADYELAAVAEPTSGGLFAAVRNTRAG